MERRAQSLHGSAPVPEPPPRPSRNSMIPEVALAGLHLGSQPPVSGGSPTLASGGSRTLLGETLPSARRGFLRKSSAIEDAGAPAPPPRASMLVQEDLDKGYVEANPAMFARGFSSRSGSTSAPTAPTAAAPAASNPQPSATGTLQRSTGAQPRPSVSGPTIKDDDHAYEYQDLATATSTSNSTPAAAAAAAAAKGTKALSKQITFDLEDSSCIGEPWYHGNLSRVDAEERLKKSGSEEGLFLVRNSSHGSASLAISVCHGGKILHHRLEMTSDRQYMFVGNALRFRSLALLIDFYVKTPDEEKYRLKRYLNIRVS